MQTLFPLGIPVIDDALGGGVPAGAVTVLAAPPDHFKTTLLLTVMCGWLEQQRKVLFISKDTTESVLSRIAAHHGDPGRLWDYIGQAEVVALGDHDEARADAAAAAMESARLAGPPPIIIVDELEAAARLARRAPDASEADHVKTFVGTLASYARATGTPVLVGIPVPKTAVYDNMHAAPADFAGAVSCGYLEYAAAATLTIQRPGGPGPVHSIRVHLVATREGQGPAVVDLLADGPRCRLAQAGGLLPAPRIIVEYVEEIAGAPVSCGDAVLAVLREHREGLSANSIAQLVRKRHAFVRTTLQELVKAGSVVTAITGCPFGTRPTMVYRIFGGSQ